MFQFLIIIGYGGPSEIRASLRNLKIEFYFLLDNSEYLIYRNLNFFEKRLVFYLAIIFRQET